MSAGDIQSWLETVGLGRLQEFLRGVDGDTLLSLNVGDMQQYGIIFSDGCWLLLLAYVTEHCVAVPHGLLSWDVEGVLEWLTELGVPAPPPEARLNGAALVTLVMIESAAGDSLSEHVFMEMRRQVKEEIAPKWAARWTAAKAVRNLPKP